MCSLLLNCIYNHVRETAKELNVTSDSCPDQNRNLSVIRFHATLAPDGKFNKIFQYLPVRGPCGRNLGFIKK